MESVNLGWRLQLLGGVVLRGAGTELTPERKTAGLLAYLCFEGPTPRARLAQLLWPESEEPTARNNMRQLLRRLRVATGTDLVEGRDILELTGVGEVDALAFEEAVEDGRSVAGLALEGTLEGELMGAHDYSDLHEFDAWLQRVRERMAALQRRAAGREVEQLELAGEYSLALSLAERMLAREPHSEDAYRRLMRLHYLLGDRIAALGLYAQCREMLKREYEAEPMPETAALARDIERARGSVQSVPRPSRAALPATVLRPPVLAGREAAWRQLEAAWEAGQMIFLSGPPGMGKSRLARDFAATKGAYLVLEGRPGDVHVPYASTSRHVRRMYQQRPDLVMEPWVRQEMARLLPELGTQPLAMASEEERMRFFEAHNLFARACMEGISSQVVDDLQYQDTASNLIGAYTFAGHFPLGQNGLPHVIICFRSGELRPDALEQVDALVEAGVAAHVKLEPLTQGEVATLLEGLGIAGLTRLSEHIARYTGGNPLYVAETVKHLLETGGLGREWPERLPPPGKVAPLIQQRLERLSRPALQLAQVAAIAESRFELELAAEVLEVGAMDLLQPVEELEAAQVFRGEGFSHDLVFEAVHAGVPTTVRRLMHRRLAQAFERRKAPPAIIAQHWQAAGEERSAVPFLLEAAVIEDSTLRHDEAAQLRRHAAQLGSA
ncbi:MULTISPECIES: AAA family ATPase [Myxococcaceae]|uniref:AAA family ATPase n=1 Tax=Myxococcaceae TaxID=31 RepID=UPI00188EE5B9|nr:AAA family ATPase [Simulacricoccus sp. 17bor-14]